MRTTARGLRALAVSLAFFALPAAASPGTAIAGARGESPPSLVVYESSFAAGLEVMFDAGGTGAPARIVLYAPRGSALSTATAVGDEVGSGIVFASSWRDDAATISFLAGTITAASLDLPAARACSERRAVAAWILELSLLGQRLEVPIVVGDPGPDAPAGTAYELTLCTPRLPAAGAALPIDSLHLSLAGLRAPTEAGVHAWRAIVTPFAIDNSTVFAESAFEVRSLMPVPHALTLKGRYVPRSHTAVLSGRLTGAGVALGGTTVSMFRIVGAGDDVRVHDVGTTRTRVDGTYVFRARASRTATYVAVSQPLSEHCDGPSPAPAGCASSTTAPAGSGFATVRVPARKKR